MFLIFAIPLFALGAIAGISILLFCIIYFARQPLNQKPHERMTTPKEPPTVKFSTSVPLKWMNTFLWVVFPSFVSLHKLKLEIRRAFARIPRDVRAVQSLTLKDFSLRNPLPPSIDGVSLVSTGEHDSIEFGFHYSPKLSITAGAVVFVPYIGLVNVNVRVSLHSFRGHMRLYVPNATGPAEIHILESTEIKCDLKAELGSLIKVETEAMNSIWQSILNWIHTYLRSKVIKIPLEEMLAEKPCQPRRMTIPARAPASPKAAALPKSPASPKSPKARASPPKSSISPKSPKSPKSPTKRSPRRSVLKPVSPKWQPPAKTSPIKFQPAPLVKTRVFMSFRDYVF